MSISSSARPTSAGISATCTPTPSGPIRKLLLADLAPASIRRAAHPRLLEPPLASHGRLRRQLHHDASGAGRVDRRGAPRSGRSRHGRRGIPRSGVRLRHQPAPVDGSGNGSAARFHRRPIGAARRTPVLERLAKPWASGSRKSVTFYPVRRAGRTLLRPHLLLGRAEAGPGPQAAPPSTRVTVLFQDLRAYGFKERWYTEARQAGVHLRPLRIRPRRPRSRPTARALTIRAERAGLRRAVDPALRPRWCSACRWSRAATPARWPRR